MFPVFVNARTHQGNALILNVSILTKEIEEKQETFFQCLQCGFTAMADYVGAIINIRLKAKLMAATVNQPIVGETLISTYKPPILIGGSRLVFYDLLLYIRRIILG